MGLDALFIFLFFFNLRLCRCKLIFILCRARSAAGPVFQIIGIFVSLPRYRGSWFLVMTGVQFFLASYTTRTSPLSLPAVLDFLKEILHPYKIQHIHLSDLNILEDRQLKVEACHSPQAGTCPGTLVYYYNHMTRQRHQVLILSLIHI